MSCLFPAGCRRAPLPTLSAGPAAGRPHPVPLPTRAELRRSQNDATSHSRRPLPRVVLGNRPVPRPGQSQQHLSQTDAVRCEPLSPGRDPNHRGRYLQPVARGGDGLHTRRVRLPWLRSSQQASHRQSVQLLPGV